MPIILLRVTAQKPSHEVSALRISNLTIFARQQTITGPYSLFCATQCNDCTYLESVVALDLSKGRRTIQLQLLQGALQCKQEDVRTHNTKECGANAPSNRHWGFYALQSLSKFEKRIPTTNQPKR